MRVGDCDVNVGEESREKAGGATSARPVHKLSDLEVCCRHKGDRSRTSPPGSVILGGDPPASSMRRFSQMLFWTIVVVNQAQCKRGQRSQLRARAHMYVTLCSRFRRKRTSVRLRLDQFQPHFRFTFLLSSMLSSQVQHKLVQARHREVGN